MPDSAPDAARETLGGALAVAERVPRAGDGAPGRRSPAGCRAAAIAGAVLLAGAAVLAAATLRRVRMQMREAAPEQEPGQEKVPA